MRDYTLAEEMTAEVTGQTVEYIHEIIEVYMGCLSEISKQRREKIIIRERKNNER